MIVDVWYHKKWFFGAIFISDDLVIADTIHLIFERCVTSLDENWQSEANESLYESCATTLRRRPRRSTAILKSKRRFDMKLTWDWHRIYIKLTQKYSSRVELFRFLGIFDIVSSDLRLILSKQSSIYRSIFSSCSYCWRIFTTGASYFTMGAKCNDESTLSIVALAIFADTFPSRAA